MPARRLPWFKLWPEAMRHEKIALLSDGAFRTWIAILAAGSEQPVRWRFASLKHAANVTARPARQIRELITARLVDEGKRGELWVHDWRQWQDRYESDFAPRTPPEHSANTARTLPPELRGEKREEEREEDVDLHPNPPPPAEAGMRAAAGEVSRDVIERLSKLPDDLTAAEFHRATEQALLEIGFSCQREVLVEDRGDGHRGRVDLVAERNGEALAIELDDRTPRQKSVRKLAGMPGVKRVVVLRCPFDGALPLPPGLDAVIGAGSSPDRPVVRGGLPSRPPAGGRPAVPTDSSAYLNGQYGAIVAERMKAKIQE